MRSFILTAAIAAALVSTSLTAGYTASSDKDGTHASRAGSATSTSAGKVAHASTRADARSIATRLGNAERRDVRALQGEHNGQADPVPPVEIYPQGWMSSSLFAPRAARLARIETEVGRAMHRINVDRRRGELTPREARVARNEGRAVRAEAVTIAREHQGAIPYPSYAMLQTRVSGLDRTIDREANHA